MDISLTANAFKPTSSFTGEEEPTVLRGQNAVIRGESDRAKIENYIGHKNLSEDYTPTALSGTIAWTAGLQLVTGTSTFFTTELEIGDIIQAGTQRFAVQSIVTDTSFVPDNVPADSGTGQTARVHPVLFEIDKQRGVMAKRGNAIKEEKKDIVFVGDGLLYLNGTSTGFTAAKRPKRLERSATGTYTEFPIGFNASPPFPVFTVGVGGWKGMQAGLFSHMISYWNSVTGGFSNPCAVVKKDGGGTDITLAASGRFGADFTTSLVGMPSNADGFIIWSSQSGGGVTAVNVSNFNEGAWLQSKKIRTTAYTIVDADVSTSADSITLPGHKFLNADSVYTNTTWGPFVADTEYFAIYIDANTLKFASTAALANAKTALDIAALPSSGAAGPWTVRSLSSTDTTFFEYLDAELGATASGDNDPPQDCRWVATFANQRMYISTLGKKTTTKSLGSSPGNYVMPVKAGNSEAAPFDWRVSVGDDITGFAGGVGRLFCQTPINLKFVTPTGKTELARLLGDGTLTAPFSERPFWTKGGISPYNTIVIGTDVFIYNGHTLWRSPSNADGANEPYEIGLPVNDLTASWAQGLALLGECQKNQQLCLISSGSKLNAAGFWCSEILPYSLQKNQWQPIILVSDDTRDMIISGVATVNGRMEFLAGGRAPASAHTVSTFRYDELPATPTPVPWYVAFQPVSLNNERQQKMVRFLRVTAHITGGILQIFGARAGGDISIDAIEQGIHSISGDIPVPDSAALTRQFEIKYLVKGLQLAGVRISGVWAGTGEVNRVDEIVATCSLHGIGQ